MEIIKGGCGTRHPSNYRMSRPEGLTNYVILVIRTSGEFQINGRHHDVSPGHALILAPNTPYFYGNPKGEYMDDWLHFNLDDTSFFQKHGLSTNEPFPIGNTEMFTSFIRQILWEKSYGHPAFSNQNAEAVFTVLINHLTAAYNTKDSLKPFNHFQDQLQLLRLELQHTASGDHNIHEHAHKMGVSESYFQHLYRDFFGISFQQDLIRLRIDYAKYIMTTTDLTLEQIAEVCGYTNEVHFYRQFKKQMGITPSKYRKSANRFDSDRERN